MHPRLPAPGRRRRKEGRKEGKKAARNARKERTIGVRERERGAPMGRTILQERERERDAVSRTGNVTLVSEQESAQVRNPGPTKAM